MEIVIPWKCHICLKDFDESSGAICSRCGKATCDFDLNLVDYKERDGAARIDQIVCNKCLKEGEKFIKFEKRFLSKSSWGRIFGI
jgi:hypothetical protein